MNIALIKKMTSAPKYYLFVILFFVNLSFQAQTAYKKNAHFISAGYSLFHYYPTYLEKNSEYLYGKQFDAYGQYTEFTARVYTPVNLSYEFGISKNLGLGLNLGYFKSTLIENRYHYYPPNVRTTEENFFLAGLQLNYHFGNFQRFDPYVGLTVGGTLYDKKLYLRNQTIDYGLQFAPDLGLSAGLRYYPVSFMALFVEAGFEHWALAEAGLVFRLN